MEELNSNQNVIKTNQLMFIIHSKKEGTGFEARESKSRRKMFLAASIPTSIKKSVTSFPRSGSDSEINCLSERCDAIGGTEILVRILSELISDDGALVAIA